MMQEPVLVTEQKSADTPSQDKGRHEFLRRRRQRNYAILAVLAGLVVLFYVLSIVRMAGS
jgi:hypothetical protein